MSYNRSSRSPPQRRDRRDDRDEDRRGGRYDDRYDDRRGGRYDDRYDDRRGGRYDDRYDDRRGGRYDDRYDDRRGGRYDDRYDNGPRYRPYAPRPPMRRSRPPIGTPEEKAESKTLFVGNLPFSASDESLRREFSQFGTVKNVTIGVDRFTQRSRGFGFIEFEERASAEAAFDKMNGAELEGRALRIDWDIGFEKKKQVYEREADDKSSNRRSQSPHRSPSPRRSLPSQESPDHSEGRD